MSKSPAVTVLMPVFNDQAFLPDSVQSILRQTFEDFEFLIINDGSTDASKQILQSLTDPRIRVLDNPTNLGITRSLRIGVEESRGTYISRMDADDISLPTRLEKQVKFLEQHPEIGILGSSCDLMNEKGKLCGRYPVPLRNLEIQWTSLFANPFAHPSVMIRRDILLENHFNYDEAFTTAQDYDLWTRLLVHTQGANLAKPLVKYRLRQGVTQTNRQKQLENHDRIALRTIQRTLADFPISLDQVTQLRTLFVGGSELTPEIKQQSAAISELYLSLFQAFLKNHCPETGLRSIQTEIVKRIGRAIVKSPLSPGWLRILRQFPRILLKP